MINNKNSWNVTLQFSWGHIIAFVALIFISYVTYMGSFYLNGGDFKASVIEVFVIDILLLAIFLGVQIFKGADSKFNRSIIIERILFCLCFFVFICAMFPYNHFWNVLNRREQIEETFRITLNGSKLIFDDYDNYANKRIADYKSLLNQIISNKDGYGSHQYQELGFSGTYDELQRDSYVRTLQIQLLSKNVDNLISEGYKWIDEANQGVTVWNAFLIGNIHQITKVVSDWESILTAYSKPVLSNEMAGGNSIKQFQSHNETIAMLNNLTVIYKTPEGVNFNTIWTSILLFLMLLFPYMLQRRNTRACGLYFLIPILHKKSANQHTDDEVIDTYTNENQMFKTSDDDIYGGTF